MTNQTETHHPNILKPPSPKHTYQKEKPPNPSNPPNFHTTKPAPSPSAQPRQKSSDPQIPHGNGCFDEL